MPGPEGCGYATAKLIPVPVLLSRPDIRNADWSKPDQFGMNTLALDRRQDFA